jgi:DNA-binding CsgD family transcriptional regulator
VSAVSREPLVQILHEFAQRMGQPDDLPQRMLARRDAQTLRHTAGVLTREAQEPDLTNTERAGRQMAARRLVDLAAALEGTPAAAIDARGAASILGPRGARITPAERRILAEFSRGGRRADVANRLGLSPQTIATTLHRMKKRTRTNSTTNLLGYAIAHGMLPADVTLRTGEDR